MEKVNCLLLFELFLKKIHPPPKKKTPLPNPAKPNASFNEAEKQNSDEINFLMVEVLMGVLYW